MRLVIGFATLGALLATARPLPAPAQTALPLKHRPEGTKSAITPADLMTRLYLYADDSMLGREAGTEANLRATTYIESQVRRLGLVPAGDSGGYFQYIPLVRRLPDARSGLAIEGVSAPLRPGVDYIARDQGTATRPVDGAEVIYGGAWGDSTMLAPERAAGKIVLVAVPRDPGRNPPWFVPRIPLTNRYRTAAGIAVASLDLMPEALRQGFGQPQFSLQGGPAAATEPPSYFYVSLATARRLVGAALDSGQVGSTGARVRGSTAFLEAPAPARNVVAILPGSDPVLRGQYVAIGAHNDHVGVTASPVDHDSLLAFRSALRKLELAAPNGEVPPEQIAAIRVSLDSLRRLRPARLDSVYNGADDDGSGTVSVLEIAEAFATQRSRPRRSLVFVWHTGEELGLFGAQYFTDHPTVPRDSIVAQLNMDMVGRGAAEDIANGGPAYLQLIGTRRLSTELGDLVEAVNRKRPQPFTFDYQYDATGHPEQYYCRSDHYMYARYGIPIAFFSTGDHRDYHQLTDEPQYIDYAKLAKVTELVHDIARAVANLDHRVVVDKPKPDPQGNCVQ
ncbi:MAG: M28 family peptidase [Gemmatimonadales bacterium]